MKSLSHEEYLKRQLAAVERTSKQFSEVRNKMLFAQIAIDEFADALKADGLLEVKAPVINLDDV